MFKQTLPGRLNRMNYASGCNVAGFVRAGDGRLLEINYSTFETNEPTSAALRFYVARRKEQILEVRREQIWCRALMAGR